jgi:hypothetical protein
MTTLCVDTPQAPSPRVDRSRPNRSDVYRSSMQNADTMTLRTCKSWWHISLHSYHSNARRSRSVPPIIIYTLVLYATYLSLIIFKIIPHPMTLLIAIPLQVIILHFIQYHLFLIAYCRITYPFPCSHIPSPRVRFTLCLTLPHSIKHVPSITIKKQQEVLPHSYRIA